MYVIVTSVTHSTLNFAFFAGIEYVVVPSYSFVFLANVIGNAWC